MMGLLLGTFVRYLGMGLFFPPHLHKPILGSVKIMIKLHFVQIRQKQQYYFIPTANEETEEEQQQQ